MTDLSALVAPPPCAEPRTDAAGAVPGTHVKLWIVVQAEGRWRIALRSR